MGVELKVLVSRRGANADISLVENESLAHSGGANIKEGWCKEIRKRGQRGSEDGGSNENKQKMTHTSKARGEGVERLIFS